MVNGRPPLSPWAPVLAWSVGAGLLAVLVLVVVPEPGPLDDPSEAAQRSGVLISGPRIDELTLPGDPLGRRPVVLVFDRGVPDRDLLGAFVDRTAGGTAVFLVVPDRPRPSDEGLAGGVRLVVDRDRAIADAVGLAEPLGGGFPIGYAVIDARARVRYRTLDPTYLLHPFEIATITRSVR